MQRSILRTVIVLLVLASAGLAGREWLARHPEHNPWAPLTLTEPAGWATAMKLQTLRGDVAQCRGFLERSGIKAESLAPTGEGQCLRDDRQVLQGPQQLKVRLAPAGTQATCAIDAGMALWLTHGIQPAATRIFGSPVARIEHLGTNNCRRIGGGADGNWSEHATGNAMDVGAFVLADGRRISVLKDWTSGGEKAAFLRAVRDTACESFSTVLSPDYNAAHADHLHLDQAQRAGGWAACR